MGYDLVRFGSTELNLASIDQIMALKRVERGKIMKTVDRGNMVVVDILG